MATATPSILKSAYVLHNPTTGGWDPLPCLEEDPRGMRIPWAQDGDPGYMLALIGVDGTMARCDGNYRIDLRGHRYDPTRTIEVGDFQVGPGGTIGQIDFRAAHAGGYPVPGSSCNVPQCGPMAAIAGAVPATFRVLVHHGHGIAFLIPFIWSPRPVPGQARIWFCGVGTGNLVAESKGAPPTFPGTGGGGGSIILNF